jgi:Mn-dependent DtxR family transcriptional regulator
VEVSSREQHYIDKFSPEYNTQKTAGSSLGHKLSEETKEKLRQSYFSRSKEFFVENRKQILKLNAEKGHPVEVINIITKETKFYPSLGQAATDLGISKPTVSKYIRNKKV